MKTNPDLAIELERIEFSRWTDLVVLLKKVGAVTEQDCKSRAIDDPNTDGKQIFDALREWGNARADVGRADARRQIAKEEAR